MIRRRRPTREIEFSFDSFLDLVANVVGIILRLILVAWIGARSYKAIVPPSPSPPPPARSEPAPLPEPTDPRLVLLQQRRRTLAQEWTESERQREEQRREIRRRQQSLHEQLACLREQEEALQKDQSDASKQVKQTTATVQAARLSVADLEKRSAKLLHDLDELGKLPRVTKKLRYNTPVSAPLQTEEVMFECYKGKVTLLDTGALLAEITRGMRAKGEQLRERWEVRDTTSTVGAFRLRYVLERERSLLDGPGAGAPSNGSYRFGVSSWEAEPVVLERGETVEQALIQSSAFRKVIDSLDPQQTAVTLWAYPDSFAMYRRLRDYLHGRGFMVAGRPLPEGVPIASSRKGTTSRGQ
jgi:hypothetical protein